MGFADALALGDAALRGILGGSITYTPTVGEAVVVDGVFDAAFQVVDGVGSSAVMSVGPAVFLTLDDLPSDPETDTAATVTVASVAYLPHTVKKDGQGGVVLLMHKVT